MNVVAVLLSLLMFQPIEAIYQTKNDNLSYNLFLEQQYNNDSTYACSSYYVPDIALYSTTYVQTPNGTNVEVIGKLIIC